MISDPIIKNDLDVPGTELLVDKNHLLGLAEDGTVVYVPQPSRDANDPLNWSTRWKLAQVAILYLYTLVNAAGLNWVGTLYLFFIQDFGVTYNQLNLASGLSYLLLAIGCWLSGLSASLMGKRLTFISSSFLVCIAALIFAIKKDYAGLFAYLCLNGIAVASMDTLVEASIGELFFLHQHGKFMAGYSFCLALGSGMGPVLAGYFNPWAWFSYTVIILSGAILILQVFFFEESTYQRLEVVVTVIGQPSNDYATDSSKGAEDQNLEVYLHHGSEDEVVGTRRTLVQRMACPMPQGRDWSIFFRVCISPFLTLRYPAVIWVSIAYGIQICWLSLMGVTMAQFYSAPPYLFSTTDIGNLNYSGVIGSVFGFATIMLSDKYHVWRSKRNNGISEPEFRLEMMFFPIIINTLGLFLYGFGPAYSMHWIVGAFGTGMICYGILCLVGLSLTYVMECYPLQISKTMVVILFIRNLMGTVFNWVFQYWLDAMGIKSLTITLAMICLAVNGVAIVFILWGKNFRKATSKTYLAAVGKEE